MHIRNLHSHSDELNPADEWCLENKRKKKERKKESKKRRKEERKRRTQRDGWRGESQG